MVAPYTAPRSARSRGPVCQWAELAEDGRDTPRGHAVKVQRHGRPSSAAHGLGGGVSGRAAPWSADVAPCVARAASLCLRRYRHTDAATSP